MSNSLWNVKQAAYYLGISAYTVYRYVERKDLPHIKKKFGLRFRKADLDEWLENDKRKSLPIPYLPRENLTKPPLTFDTQWGGISEMAKSKSKTRYNFGYGSIYIRKTKSGKIRWSLDYYDEDHERVQEVEKNALTKEDAFIALKNKVLKAFYKRNGIKCNEKMGFREFSQVYLRDYAMAEKKKSWMTDEFRLRKLREFFKDVELGAITTPMIRKFRDQRLKEGNLESTCNRYLALLRKMFNFALEEGYVDQNPVKKIKLFSETDLVRNRVLTEEEEGRLFGELTEHIKPFVLTALHTGMRKGELLNLKWKNVDFEKRIIKVEKTKSKRTRFIPINSVLFNELRKLKLNRENQQYVFPFKNVRTAFESACRRAGIDDFTFHDVRRTFGTRLLEAGVNIVTISKLFGHSSVLVTQRYLHPKDKLSKEAVEVLVKNPNEKVKNEEDLLHNCDMEKEKQLSRLPIASFSMN